MDMPKRIRKLSVTYKTIFYNSKKPLVKWLEFIQRFAQGLRLRQLEMIEDDIAGSSKTLSRKLRQVCMRGRKRLYRRGMQVGRKHHFVVIDEAKFCHKWKYNRGRWGNTWRRGRSWVFGMLEVGATVRRPVLKVVQTRSREVLCGLIRKHVRPGSAIVSDEWGAYRGHLTGMGYRRRSVCHRQNFVDPATFMHTQHIERAWQSYEIEVWRHRGNRTIKSLREHLKIIEWTFWLCETHRHHVLGRLLHDVKRFNSSLL